MKAEDVLRLTIKIIEAGRSINSEQAELIAKARYDLGDAEFKCKHWKDGYGCYADASDNFYCKGCGALVPHPDLQDNEYTTGNEVLVS